MRRLFGGSKEKKPTPTLSETSQKVGNRAEAIEKKINELDKELLKYKQELQKTKSLATKQRIKQKALQVLKRKKMYEQQRDQLLNQQFNIDQTAFVTENLQDTVETVKAMKSAVKVLKKQTKEFDIDKVEALQDEMQDLMDDANEIQEIMSRTYSTPDDIDENELLDELDALEDEMQEDTSYLDDLEVPDKKPEKSSEKREESLETELGLQ